MKKNLTLRSQLTLASMMTTLLALVIMAGSSLSFEIITYRGILVRDLQTQAELLANSISATLVFNDPKTATENLALLEQKGSIRAAAIYRNNGDIFASYRSVKSETVPHGTEPILTLNDSAFEGATLEVTYQIVQEGERIGTVYLRAKHDVVDRLFTYLAILGASIIPSLIIAVFIFGRLQKKATRPLLKMSEVARQVISRRDWTLRAPPTNIPDIAVLVDGFNRMLDEVQTATGELEHETVERRHAQERLILADRRKDEFLATLAHELRNPLAPMTNAVALIRMPKGTRPLREKATAILERQLKHMVRLIDDLLDVSRVATGKLLLNRNTVDIVGILGSAAELAEPLMIEREVTFKVTLPSQPCLLVADSARLLQVFSNLLNNASRYTNPGGTVEMFMETSLGEVSVHVRDNGIGIEKREQDKIFELFEQADKTLERGNTGLGIGLTLARQLVHLHDGAISVFSEGLGKGSTFTVRLPVAEQQTIEFSSPPVSLTKKSSVSLRIVLADDNVDFASSLNDVLCAFGHNAVVVNDGTSALRAIEDEQPDIAILDIGMPGLNGYEVARRVRSNPKLASIPLVAMTGWGQASDKAEASRAGFNHHLVKPVSPDDLLSLLSKYTTLDVGKTSDWNI